MPTTDKAVIALSDDELRAEADALSRRVAHSTLPARDALLVIELATRLRAPAHINSTTRT